MFLLPLPLFGTVAGAAGPGVISSASTGLVSLRLGVPTTMRVLLAETLSGRLLEEKLAINGVYSFVGYRLGAHYTLRIRDRSGQLNGAVVDWVSAELP